MGICLEKCHFGFSKSSKFKRVVLLILMTLGVRSLANARVELDSFKRGK